MIDMHNSSEVKSVKKTDVVLSIIFFLCYASFWYELFSWGANFNFSLFIIFPFIIIGGIIIWVIAVLKMTCNLLMPFNIITPSGRMTRWFLIILLILIPFSSHIIGSPTAYGARYMIWKTGGIKSIFEWGMNILKKDPDSVVIGDNDSGIKETYISNRIKTIINCYDHNEGVTYSIDLIRKEDESPYIWLIMKGGGGFIGHWGLIIFEPDSPPTDLERYPIQLYKGIHFFQFCG